MTEPVSLIPIKPGEIALGETLSRPIYDWHGKLLMAVGAIVNDQKQLDSLVQNGFFPEASWDIAIAEKTSTATGSDRKPALQNNTTTDEEASRTKEVSVGMDEIHWHVGETFFLQLLDKSAIRYTVKLIGFVKNKTVFVTAPNVDGKFTFIRDEQPFVVRAISGKKAYAFTASAVKSVHAPHPYLHLTYPKEVRCTMVRSGLRAEVKIIASISIGTPEVVAAGTIIDVSIGGTSAIVKDMLAQKGAEGRIKFKVRAADQDEYLNLKVLLRSVSAVENGTGFKHGFEFIDLSSYEKMILSAFVHQTLVEIE